MRRIRCWLSLLFAFACASGGAAASADSHDKCDATNASVEVRSWVEGIRDYQLTAVVTMHGESASSEIAGSVPGRLRIVLSAGEGEAKSTQTIVYDGTNEWVELRSSSETRAYKLDLSQLVKPDRPFDTGFAVMGSGLLTGEDLPTTLSTLLDLYDVSSTCEGMHYVLRGSIDPAALARYAKKRAAGTVEPGFVDRYAETFPLLELTFDPEARAVLGYRLGAQVREMAFAVQFVDLKINEEPAPEAFRYQPPPGVEPENITEQVRQQRAE